MTVIPRITTRGYYDLYTGDTLKNNAYFLYPKKEFKKLVGSKELTVMIHGLRNDRAGAVAKAVLAKKRLRVLGYTHPVIGYSYDSNTTGAHLAKQARRALGVGQKIAKKNGKNLGLFIEDFKATSPKTRIRLMGHSLGSQVILSTLEYLAKKRGNIGAVDSVYFFGASIAAVVPSSKKYGKILQSVVDKKIVNYYAPTDEVLAWADEQGHVRGPLGLNGAVSSNIEKKRAHVPKYSQKLVRPKNHRFTSYAAVLKSFP